MTRRAAFLGLLLALAPFAGARADGVVLAPGPGAASAPGPSETTVVEDRSWKLCEVTASILATAPGRSIVAGEKQALVYLGEQLDIEADVTIPVAQGIAMVHAKARLRAAAATEEAVTYFINSDGILRSTIGFRSEAAGRDEFRSEMLIVSDESTRLHEIFALPEQSLRVVMVLRVRRVSGRQEQTALQMVTAARASDIRRFRVQAFLKDGATEHPLENASLSALDGHEASLALTRFQAEAQGAKPVGLPAAQTVRKVQMTGVPETPAKEMGAVHPLAADDRFQERIDALQRSLKIDPTVDLGKKLPGQVDPKATPKKMSARKKAKLQEQQKEVEVRRWAIEQSKTLPSSSAVPEGFQREELLISVTPLRATAESLQIELTLRGHLKLPGEDQYTSIDATTVEQVRFGETLEVGLADLVRKDQPRYDYVLRITPEP